MSFPSTSKESNPQSKSRLLQGLNPEQEEAVAAADGPVLIIAGAGTGKTRVIAHRIALLLEKRPDLSPSQVLALTFSRKAAREMLERIEGLLGTPADEPAVFTFHSFCHRFLKDHALECGLPPRFQLLERAESWIFFRRLLSRMRLASTWSLSDPTDCIDGYLRFIGRAKDELVSPEEFAAAGKGIFGAEEQARAGEIERAYRIYQERMREAGYLDFGDLIVEALAALRRRSGLLKELQAQYRYILVDEFQDTNVAQIALLRLLAGEAGNLCVVGDDDQAIYRFRGASFASFLLMKEAFPQVRTLRLTRNYRSTPQILSVAERLIRRNEPDRYDAEKRLRTANPDGAPVELLVCRDEGHEAQVVARTIEAVLEGQPLQERRYDRIAVLYRAHSQRDLLTEALREAGIPFLLHGGPALFGQTEIRDLISFLRIIQDPSDSVHLFRVLSHPIWGIPHEELLMISRSAKEGQWPLWDSLKRASTLSLADGTRQALDQFLQELGQIRREAARMDPARIVQRVAEESSFKTIFRIPGEGSDPLISLGRFLRLTFRYAQIHPGGETLEDFLWYLDSYLRAGGDPAEEEPEGGGNQVRLMTVHQAKGLEFDWVILLGLVQGRFPARRRPEPIPFPIELMKEPLPKGDYHLQEERRLCYVACTRAKRGLFLMTQERIYHRPSVFVREMSESADEGEIRRRVAEPPSDDAPPLKKGLKATGAVASLAVEREVLRLLQEIRSVDPGDAPGLSSRLERIRELAGSLRPDQKPAAAAAGPMGQPPPPVRYSYTQLETYRYCPMKYRYSYIFQIPVKPTPQMLFGTDLHACLEDLFSEVMKGRVPPLEELLISFQRLQAKGRYGEPYQDEEYRRLGGELLTSFYKKHEGAFAVPVFVEKSFLLQMEDAWIRGVMDRVDPLPEGGVEIIDYKSGKPKEDANPEEQLQLRLYALAAKEVFHLQPRKVSFYYLRNNQKLSFRQEPEALEETRGKIMGMIGAIRTGDFTPTPSLMKCRRCDFKALCPASMA
ncbi:MAG: ATP-dependent helicase [Candidatus Omnitrophica bacterium]|nr:ATP-dependent helicase [Candidatus Omnitrophota bacterium]